MGVWDELHPPWSFMNQVVLEKLTFGFEIEGMFKEGMNNVMEGRGRFVSDGSVGNLNPAWPCEIIPQQNNCPNCVRNTIGRIERYCPEHHAYYHNEGAVAREYASEVHQGLDVLDTLKKFNSQNHTWNETCGLHFHVGMKDGKWTKLFGIVSNSQFLKQLHQEALGYCDCQKARLQNHERRNHYYEDYSGSMEIIQSSRGGGSKYRFVRFHPHWHTLEFRFLCPCEHKVQNITKLLNSLTAYLGRSETIHRYTSAIVSGEPVKADINLKLEQVKDFNIVKRLKPGKINAVLRFLHGSPEPFKYLEGTGVLSRSEMERATELNYSWTENEPARRRIFSTTNSTWL